MLDIINNCAWEEICDTDGIKIYKTKLDEHMEIAGREMGGAAKFLCVKAEAILDATPEEVYKLFVDNTRVGEYNEFCKQIHDLQYINQTTKITWSASGRIGPFKERDFVTRVHYRSLEDGTLLVANRAEDHPKAPQTDRYLRMEIVVGGNIMKAAPGEKGKTHFTMLTHVNPGGVAETRLGTIIMNGAAASGPLKFVQGLRACLVRDSLGVPPPKMLDESAAHAQEVEFGRFLLEARISETKKILQTCPAGIT